MTRQLWVSVLMLAMPGLAAADPALDQLVDKPFSAFWTNPDPGVEPFGEIGHATLSKRGRGGMYRDTADIAGEGYHCFAVVAVVPKGIKLQLAIAGTVMPHPHDLADHTAAWDTSVQTAGGTPFGVSTCLTPHSGKLRVSFASSKPTTLSYRVFEGPMSKQNADVMRDGHDRCIAKLGASHAPAAIAYCDDVSWCGPGTSAARCYGPGDAPPSPDPVDTEEAPQTASRPAQAPAEVMAHLEDKDHSSHPYAMNCGGQRITSVINGGIQDIPAIEAHQPCTISVDGIGSAKVVPHGTCTIENHQLSCR